MTNSNAGTPGGEKQRSSRPRRRGRRRRGGGQGETAPEKREQVEQQKKPEQGPQASAAPKGERNDRGERGGRGRRRGGPNRRPRVAELEDGRVLRESSRQTAPVQPMRKRKISEEFDETEPQFGCPMLTRTRIGIPFRGGQNVPRCSMGWAVHDEDEVLFCMHTPSRNLCWKENPEQLEALIEKLRPQIEAELAGRDSAAD
ncbi:MAG TPA: hypothetical protein VKZ61_07150 [Thermomicrobiales bacterium]|nr:hypothetical protein [Thermomicrobiales bacterium]